MKLILFYLVFDYTYLPESLLKIFRGRYVMPELLKTAITGFNIIPTILLCMVLLYWITVIIGALDLDVLDIDLDLDVEAEADGEVLSGPLHAILGFLNVSELPLMLVFSIIILIFWIISMLFHLLPIQTGGFISGILLIPSFLVSLVVSKFVTSPLKPLFKDFSSAQKYNTIEGKLCTLLCDLSFGRLGQGEIETEGASIVINVRVQDGETLKKGDKAFIIKKDEEKNFYIVTKFEGVN